MPYARHFLLVVEPTWQSMLTARRIIRIARHMRGDVQLSLVVNKSAAASDASRAQDFLGVPLLATVPADEDVHAAEHIGVAVLDSAPTRTRCRP